LACGGITKLPVADGDAVADGLAGDDADEDVAALGDAPVVEAAGAAPYAVPAGAGDAATMLKIHSTTARTAPVPRVM
jgi:hypothetical protein